MSVDPLRFIRPDFLDLEAYEPVKPLEVLAAEIGLPVERLVKLDANENLYGPLPEVRDAVAAADLHIYTDPTQSRLREMIAEYLGVPAEAVVAGAGSDDLIDIMIRLTSPSAIVNATPTFGMYSFLGKMGGARIVEVPRTPGPAFEPDIPGIGRAVRAGATLVFLASPNNPTGNALSMEQVEALCNMECIVVIDEAYAEFAGRSAVAQVQQHPNLVVLRTFSKWAALAGLRVGYAVAAPQLASHMMAIKQPYNVSVAADAAARVALEQRGVLSERVSAIVAERERLTRDLGQFDWLRPLPSEANFVLVKVVGRDAKAVVSGLRTKGVLIRYYSRPDLAGYIRISAGRPEDTDRLLEALRAL
ncbi:MAG: histidinol-phosphate transaminase [Dehalococcoidia bacterium]